MKQPAWALPATIVSMVAVAVLGLAGCIGLGAILPQDDPIRVVAPADAPAAETVRMLDRATRAQGVCYGWQLTGSSSSGPPISVGSNAGVGVDVRGNTGCRSWLELSVQVEPTARRTKVQLWVIASNGQRGVDGPQRTLGLGSVGYSEQTFLADTGLAVLQAARVLPLIAAEDGLGVAISAEPSAAAALKPLPAVGNDFWRDRATAIWLGLGLVGGAVVGLFLVRRRPPTARSGAARSGAARSGTAEKASRRGTRTT